MSAIEFIFWLVGAGIALGVIISIVKKAHENGMRVFLSKEYAILIFGAIISAVAVFAVEPKETGLLVGAGLAALIFLFVTARNVNKSSVVFGIIFTLFQTLMLSCFALIVVAALGFVDRRKSEV